AWKARKERQLVLRPREGAKGGAEPLDFSPVVKGASADEQVRDPSRLQRLDVRTRDVAVVADEPSEQHADLAGANRHQLRLAVFAAHVDRPPALVNEPV